MKRIILLHLPIVVLLFSCSTTMPPRAVLTPAFVFYPDSSKIHSVSIDSKDAKVIWDNLENGKKVYLKPFIKPYYLVNFIRDSDTIIVGTQNSISTAEMFKDEIFWQNGNSYFTKVSFSKLLQKYTFMFHPYGTKDSLYFAESSLKNVIHQDDYKFIWSEIASYDSAFSGKIICLDTILHPTIDSTLNWPCSILVNTNPDINSVGLDTVYVQKNTAKSIGSYLLSADTLSLNLNSNYIIFLTNTSKSKYLQQPLFNAFKWLECN